MKLLIVDDDPKFRSYIRQGLEENGLECRTAGDAHEASRVLAEEGHGSFGLILLDVMMPGPSGWEFLAELRANKHDTPVIFLTARQEVDERVKGLELGADDYIIKPFDFSELQARIAAVTRRRRDVPVLEAGSLHMDLARRIVELGGTRVETSPLEFDLLHTLVEGAGRVFSRTELLRTVWNLDFDPGTNVVDVSVARLRRKTSVSLIQTVVGKGYRFAAPEAASS